MRQAYVHMVRIRSTYIWQEYVDFASIRAYVRHTCIWQAYVHMTGIGAYDRHATCVQAVHMTGIRAYDKHT